MLISSSVINILISMVVLGILLPIVACVVWKIISKDKVKPMLIGAVIFAVFALVLETIPKSFLFSAANPLGKTILSSAVLTSIVGGLLAGIFEEGGRFVAFKWLLKDNKDRKTAISYGLGHGGFEVMVVMSYAAVQYLYMATMINNGTFDNLIAQVAVINPDQAANLELQPILIASIGISNLLLSIFERMAAVIIHISCSIIVFKAVHEKKSSFLALAVLVHASIDLIAGFAQTGIITNVYVIEAIIMTWAIALMVITYKFIYKKLLEQEEENNEPA